MKTCMLGLWALAATVTAAAATAVAHPANFIGAKASLGRPADLLARMAVEKTAQTKAFNFPALGDELIPVAVEDFYHKDGYLSMVGRALEAPTEAGSDFILKGGNQDLYGWVVLKQRNLAYEYTTDAQGNLMVEIVPVEKIF